MPRDEARSVGSVIRELRRAKGWTQKQLATRSKLTEATISNLERDAHPRTYGATIEKIAHALGIDPEHLDSRRLSETVAVQALTFEQREAISRLLRLSDEDVTKVLQIVEELQRRRARKTGRKR